MNRSRTTCARLSRISDRLPPVSRWISTAVDEEPHVEDRHALGQLDERVAQRQAEVLLIEGLLELRADRLLQLVGRPCPSPSETHVRRGARATAGRAPRETALRTLSCAAIRRCIRNSERQRARRRRRRNGAQNMLRRANMAASAAADSAGRTAMHRRCALGVVCTPDCSISCVEPGAAPRARHEAVERRQRSFGRALHDDRDSSASDGPAAPTRPAGAVRAVALRACRAA